MRLRLWFVCIVLAFAVLVDARRSRNRIRKRPKSYAGLHSWQSADRRCGYEGCPKPIDGMLNVHLVPHTHDDVGWLKTVDQYYYGTRARITKVSVQSILDSVVTALLDDPAKRFIYVESAFFFKWWKEQSVVRQRSVRRLVNEGRLEFIGGAWSMNDEATVHYQSTIDQFSWGLRRLNETFGECGRPRVGWQIDPFGHSREQASLFAQMGYDGLFFGRLDYRDKAARLLEKRAEFVWKASANLGAASDLFTGVLYNNYGPPPGFCFDILCNDEPIVDAYRSPENNVQRRVNEFVKYVQDQSAFYRTDNLLLTMGGDFTYTDAQVYFKNMDKLVSYTNARQANGSKVNLFYSTPSCYLKSLHQASLEWTSKSDDFFPYASDPHAYWTGYFTSRPTLKRFERLGNEFLQVCKQLNVLAPSRHGRSFDYHLNFMREAMGVMQHHDAVTGTEQQHVAEDYARRLMIALRACGVSVRNVLNQLTAADTADDSPGSDSEEWTDEAAGHPAPRDNFTFDTCYALNISQCAVSEQSDRFIVTVYNPLAHSTVRTVRVPIAPGQQRYEVRDYRNVAVQSVLVPIAADVQAIAYRTSNATHELLFVASELPPLGYKSYYVQRFANVQPNVVLFNPVYARRRRNWRSYDAGESVEINDAGESIEMGDAGESFEIGNAAIRLQFGGDGQLQSISSGGEPKTLKQTFFYYAGASGDNKEFANRSSGAYIFRPNGTETLLSGQVQEVRVVRTELVEEVHQTFNAWLSQVVRVYPNSDHVEFEWLVGEIPVQDGIGKEIVTRFSSDLRTDGVFYTDSNGREMLRRVRNAQHVWNETNVEAVAGNYYPVTARIVIEDDRQRLAVLNDRAQGGSSLVDGAIDLMIHRRLLHDDAFGVGEALNETAFGRGLIVRGSHWLTFGSKTEQPAIERRLQLSKMLPGWVFLSDSANFTYDDWRERFTNIYSGLSLSLPQNVNLLTLEPWTDGSILIRFEHILERADGSEATEIRFNLSDVLRGLQIVSLRETTLAANQWLSDMQRLEWRVEGEESGNDEDFVVPPSTDDDFEIVLQPMQIRTFVLYLQDNLSS